MRLTAQLTKLNLITHLDRGALANLLRGLCTMGGNRWCRSKSMDNGEIADRLSDAVAVSFYRK